MRKALPLFLVTGVALLMAAPLPSVRGVQTNLILCAPANTDAQRDWLGSLQGWPDSFLVLNWRAFIAATKGRPMPSPCR